jgi:hypothetical protein
MEVFVWLAKLLRWGNFKRVSEPLYYRLDHPKSFTSEYFRSSEDRMRAVRTTLFTGLLEAVMPLCATPAERLFFQRLILERLAGNASDKIITEFLERLKLEGNTQLLSQEELTVILQELKGRPDSKVLEQSRLARIAYRIQKRSRISKIIFPRSKASRFVYQIRHIFEEIRLKITRLFSSLR